MPLLRVLAVLVGAVGCAGVPHAAAKPYPSRPIRLIVPYPPGGPVDFTGREAAQELTETPPVADTLPGFNNTSWYGLLAPAAHAGRGAGDGDTGRIPGARTRRARALAQSHQGGRHRGRGSAVIPS